MIEALKELLANLEFVDERERCYTIYISYEGDRLSEGPYLGNTQMNFRELPEIITETNTYLKIFAPFYNRYHVIRKEGIIAIHQMRDW